MLPLALQLVGFRLDKGLLLPALPFVAAVIFLSSAPSVPLTGCENRLLAALPNLGKWPQCFGGREGGCRLGWGKFCRATALKLHDLVSGEGAGMGMAPFGKPAQPELGAER